MSIAKDINEILKLGGKQCYYHKDGTFWNTLKRFPGILMDPCGYVKFRTEEEYRGDNRIKRGDGPGNQRININTEYISCLSEHKSYKPFNNTEKRKVDQIIIGESKFQDEDRNLPPVLRKRVNIDSIKRIKRHVDKVKKIRNNTCQICAIRLGTEDRPYSEVHHIQPLGSPHEGYDIIENMICVCPNCHKKLDYLYIPIDENIIDQQNNDDHRIDLEFIRWHNDRFKDLYGRQ